MNSDSLNRRVEEKFEQGYIRLLAKVEVTPLTRKLTPSP
jgi:hypothetical protein